MVQIPTLAPAHPRMIAPLWIDRAPLPMTTLFCTVLLSIVVYDQTAILLLPIIPEPAYCHPIAVLYIPDIELPTTCHQNAEFRVPFIPEPVYRHPIAVFWLPDIESPTPDHQNAVLYTPVIEFPA